MEELISIVMASYNCGRFIEASIHSVLSQTYSHWELLITDDGSQDDTVSIAKKYVEMDNRIKLYCLSDNMGAGVARNNSIKEASGKYIAFLDSDDMWMPTKLEKQIQFMKERDCALSYTSYLVCKEDNRVKGIVVAPRRHTFFNNICDDKIGFSTAVYDVEKLGKIYLPDLRKRQDWGLTMRLLSRCKVSYGMKEPLGYYRVGQDSLSKSKWRLIKYQIAAYMKVLHWGRIHATLFFLFVFLPCNLLKKLELKYINR